MTHIPTYRVGNYKPLTNRISENGKLFAFANCNHLTVVDVTTGQTIAETDAPKTIDSISQAYDGCCVIVQGLDHQCVIDYHTGNCWTTDYCWSGQIAATLSDSEFCFISDAGTHFVVNHHTKTARPLLQLGGIDGCKFHTLSDCGRSEICVQVSDCGRVGFIQSDFHVETTMRSGRKTVIKRNGLITAYNFAEGHRTAATNPHLANQTLLAASPNGYSYAVTHKPQGYDSCRKLRIVDTRATKIYSVPCGVDCPCVTFITNEHVVVGVNFYNRPTNITLYYIDETSEPTPVWCVKTRPLWSIRSAGDRSTFVTCEKQTSSVECYFVRSSADGCCLARTCKLESTRCQEMSDGRLTMFTQNNDLVTFDITIRWSAEQYRCSRANARAAARAFYMVTWWLPNDLIGVIMEYWKWYALRF
jgi:hypothetical protein